MLNHKIVRNVAVNISQWELAAISQFSNLIRIFNVHTVVSQGEKMGHYRRNNNENIQVGSNLNAGPGILLEDSCVLSLFLWVKIKELKTKLLYATL